MMLKTVLLTLAEVAKRTKTSIPSVYRWMNPSDPYAPRLESFKAGREQADLRDRVRGLLKEGGTVAMATTGDRGLEGGDQGGHPSPRATTPPIIAKLEGGLNCWNCTRIAGSAATCSTNRGDTARRVSK